MAKRSTNDGLSKAGRASLSHESATAVLEAAPVPKSSLAAPMKRPRASTPAFAQRHSTAHQHDEHGGNRQAELFYLQKQIQQQTPMIFVMEDGARVQGVIEWYDRHSIKIRGKSRVLVFKSAIKYLYKAGEVGTAPGE